MTLLEVIMVLTILVTMIFIVVQLFFRSNQAQDLANRLNRATELNQALLQEIRIDLGSSVRLFEEDALGAAYLAILDQSRCNPPISGVLPTIDPDGIFRQESATGSLTGNTLFFANHSWTDEYECASGKRYLIEVYRLVKYYLAHADEGPSPGSPGGLNLCRWVGEPMVDGDQIDAIFDAMDQAEVLDHLLRKTPDVDGTSHPAVVLVWHVGEDPAAAGTFRQILPGGGISSVPVAPRGPTWTVMWDPILSSNGLLQYRHFSVATNYAPASAGVGRFSVMNLGGDGFPHGFEIQIIGPSAGRQVLLHLALMSTRRGGLPTSSSQRIVVNTREM